MVRKPLLRTSQIGPQWLTTLRQQRGDDTEHRLRRTAHNCDDVARPDADLVRRAGQPFSRVEQPTVGQPDVW
jgi:hypothetical protein